MSKKNLGLYVYPQNQVLFQYDDVISLIGHTGKAAQPSVSRYPGDTIMRRFMFGRGNISYGAVKHEQSGDVYHFSALQSSDYTTELTISITSSQGNYNGTFHGCLIGTRHDNNNTQRLYYGYLNTNNNSFRGFVWRLNNETTITNIFAVGFRQRDYEYSLTSFGRGYYSSTCRVWVPYFRTVSPQPARYNLSDPIPDDDITESFNNNYKSVVWDTLTLADVLPHIAVSTQVSDVDKGYGRVEGTPYYYDMPDNTQKWVPVRKDSWIGGVSMWVGNLYVSRETIVNFSEYKYVEDFYLLGDAIKALVNEIDSSITFDTDETHSQFLFARTNPVSGQTQGGLYVSQKSNILKLDYDYPAWLAPIKWSQIETFLKNALGCYYHIDENNHLHIEHITYYENGGSYYTNDRTLLDVTALIDVANRQPVAGKTNQWTWDKDGNGLYSSANRYEYSWMDTQSEIFDGATIVIPDEYNLFTEDKLEDRQIDWFSSDIDFLTSVPSECSSDGFAVVMEDVTNVGSVISGNPNYGGQNYELSLEYLQPKYLIQGIYAEMVRIGNTNYPNTFMARMRTAEVEFTMPAEDWETNPVTHETHDTWVSPDEIIKTDVGEGLIDSLEVDLHSGKWKATIRYENE